jgi:uncharacterized membrane protein (DUF2068 family)
MAGFDELRAWDAAPFFKDNSMKSPAATPCIPPSKMTSGTCGPLANSHKYPPSFTVEAGTHSPIPTPQGIMTRLSTAATEPQTKHNKWLVLIASYKTLQAILFVLIGLGARHLLHKDVGDEVAALADHFRFNPESRLVNIILDRATLLNDPILRRIGILAFAYATLSYFEGIGLFFEKVWAEYLTLIITASFLPFEIVEIFRRQTWFRFSLLAVNLLVFVYLLQLLLMRARERAAVNQEAAS